MTDKYSIIYYVDECPDSPGGKLRWRMTRFEEIDKDTADEIKYRMSLGFSDDSKEYVWAVKVVRSDSPEAIKANVPDDYTLQYKRPDPIKTGWLAALSVVLFFGVLGLLAWYDAPEPPTFEKLSNMELPTFELKPKAKVISSKQPVYVVECLRDTPAGIRWKMTEYDEKVGLDYLSAAMIANRLEADNGGRCRQREVGGRL